jgi:transketolase
MQLLPASRLEPTQLRKHILHMAYAGNSVHIGCAFSIVEILAALYTSVLHIDPTDPLNSQRDVMVLSKGHGVMAAYAVHREIGWLEQKHLDEYFSDGSLLHGLCESKIPGLEVCSGSLGHGLPIAVGQALGLKRLDQQNSRKRNVYCIVGDGEMNEGPMWESLLFAAHHKLENFTVIVDANGFQAMGSIPSVLNLEPLAEKFTAFGFDTIECDGHNLSELRTVLTREAKSHAPKAIVARTIKGKGVSFMENNNDWHYSRLTPELRELALREVSGETR